MKTTSSPESYKYWTFFVSVRTRENFSPARKVRSTTAPLSRFFTFVRTNAPPLPGFTCWNSTIRQTPPSSSMCIPFLNWFVLTVSAIGTSLGNRHEFLGERGQHLTAVLGDDDQILDPDHAEAGEVDPRLDGDDVSGLELVFRLLREPRRLVDEQADAVPEAVAELLAEAGRVDPPARGRVGGTAGDARTDGIQAGLLPLEADGIGLAQLVRERPGRERAGAVGAVAADRAAGVDDDGRLGRDPPVARMGMRHRAVLAGGDDGRERWLVGAELVEELLEPPGQLALRPAREPLFGQPFVCLARDLGRAPDLSELTLVLDRPQRLHHAASRHQLEPSRRQRLVAGVSNRVGLEAEPARQPLGEVGEHVPPGDPELDAFDLLACLRVAEVAEQPYTVRLEDEGGVRALEAGQVADVDRERDEERLLEPSLQLLEAAVHADSFRNSSASRYPSGPLPMMRRAARSAMTECFRHSSRAPMSERCTSTTGTRKSSTASRIA